MAPRASGRQAIRAVLAATLPLTVAACTLPEPTAVPSPIPTNVVVDPEPRESEDRCRFTSSYPHPTRVAWPEGLRDPDRPEEVRDKLVVGVDPSDATMSHWNAETKSFEGFNIDLVKAVAAALWAVDPLSHVVFRVVPPGESSFGHLKPPTEKEGVDMIATSLTATCDRAERVLFSDNYLDSGQTVLVRVRKGEDEPDSRGEPEPEFPGVEDLGGRKVCAAAGTTSLKAIANYRTTEGKRLVPVQAEHSIDCLVMLRQGQVDAVSTDENILRGFTGMADDVTLVTEPPPDDKKACTHHRPAAPGQKCTWIAYEPHAFAFRRGDRELAEFVNHVLAQSAETAWKDAYGTWLKGHPNPTKPTPGPPLCVPETDQSTCVPLPGE